MAIVKSVKITWRGVEYSIAITMALINRIEEEVNLMRLAVSLRSGDPPMSHVAVVFAHLLAAGGCTIPVEGKPARVITDADVWNAMFQDSEMTALEVVTAATAALTCVFPDVRVKALEGGDTGPKKPTTKTLATRGKNSTKRQQASTTSRRLNIGRCAPRKSGC